MVCDRNADKRFDQAVPGLEDADSPAVLASRFGGKALAGHDCHAESSQRLPSGGQAQVRQHRGLRMRDDGVHSLCMTEFGLGTGHSDSLQEFVKGSSNLSLEALD